MRPRLFIHPALIFILALASCAGQVRPDSAPKGPPSEFEGVVIGEEVVLEEPVGEESYGPAIPPGEGEAESPAIAEPAAEVPESQEPKLCLVLGPGMAKALAQAAVLEEIRKAGLPVHCVVGTEMGAVVGALYSQANGSTNSLQWQLFKFNKENYFNFPLISLREPKSSGDKLHGFLRDIFKRKRIEDLPIRFGTVASDLDRGVPVPFDKGDLADALSATLAMPGIFDPWRAGGESLASGAVTSPAPFELARSLGGNFLVLIDVVEDSARAPKGDARFQRAFSSVRNLIRLQKRDADFVIQVKAGALPFDDFSRQGEILAAGSRAAESTVPRLKAEWEKRVAGQQ